MARDEVYCLMVSLAYEEPFFILSKSSAPQPDPNGWIAADQSVSIALIQQTSSKISKTGDGGVGADGGGALTRFHFETRCCIAGQAAQ